MLGEMNENVTGNGINQCRNTFECFDVSKLEDCKYCVWFHESKNCMDIYAWGFPVNECYECMEAGAGTYHTLFSVSTYQGADVLYSYYSMNSKNLFGCVSSQSKQYCILNKQYTKEQYESLLPKIIEHMQGTGEWGEFFPMAVSPLAYNQTVAQDYLPISSDQAKNLGAMWHEEASIKTSGEPISIPDSLLEVDKSICDQVFICAESGKPYKITTQEFQFYQKYGIPVPAFSFEVRHKHRLARRNPRQLWDRSCVKCAAPLRTSYAPERPEIVYCEECYASAVY